MQDGEKVASEREVQEENRDGREREGKTDGREGYRRIRQIEKSGKKGGREKKIKTESDLNLLEIVNDRRKRDIQ